MTHETHDLFIWIASAAPLIVAGVVLLFTWNVILAAVAMISFLPISATAAHLFKIYGGDVPMTEYEAMASLLVFGIGAHHFTTMPLVLPLQPFDECDHRKKVVWTVKSQASQIKTACLAWLAAGAPFYAISVSFGMKVFILNSVVSVLTLLVLYTLLPALLFSVCWVLNRKDAGHILYLCRLRSKRKLRKKERRVL